VNQPIVTIAGKPGSGKSTVAKALAARLALDHVSAGDFMRQMAAERGITVLALSRVAESDPKIDREIDARSRTLGETRDGFVIDARLAWYFIPHSFKVFLDVTLDVAADRIYDAQRGSEVENIDLAATRHNIELRTASESQRYHDYYGIDYLDPANYDLIVDTSHTTVPEIVDEIVAAVHTIDPAKR
jgi:cytidylate kinase